MVAQLRSFSSYLVVYDLAREGFPNWTFVIVASGFMILSLGLIVYDWRKPMMGLGGAYRRLFIWFSALVVFTMLPSAIPDVVSEYRSHVQALRERRYVLVEGIVENFSPAPSGGHRDETFDVAGHHYSYSDYVVVAGYHQTQSHGGFVRQGAHVRIADLNGTILRLEILQ